MPSFAPRLALLAVALVLASACTRNVTAASSEPRPAPAFTLPLASGGDLSLASLKGHRLVISFYAGYY